MSIGVWRCILIPNLRQNHFTAKTPRRQVRRGIDKKKKTSFDFRLSWRLGVLAVILGFPFAAQAQDSLAFLPGTKVFAPLIADPREIHSSVSSNGAWDTFEGDIGDTIELLQWLPKDKTSWAWGIEAASDIQLNALGNGVFPERVSDWYLGTYFSESAGDVSHRLEYLHVSSHLGDSLFTVEPRIIFTRESFRWTTAWQVSPTFRVYGGLGYYPHMAPDDKRFYAHWGGEVYTDNWPVIGILSRGYFGYDGKFLTEAGGVFDQNFQLGVQFRAHPDSTRSIRLAVSYYNGNSLFGQFYQRGDNHWEWGVYFDP